MKKFLPILLCVLAFSNGYSQEYKKFRVGVGGGFGYYTSDVNNNGLPLATSMYLEPSFRITDNIAVGYKLEIVMPFVVPYTSSQSITGQYYFSKKSFRPFAGVGIGIFNTSEHAAGENYNCDCGSTIEGNKIGFLPRAGFDFGHLTVILEYNWMTQFKETHYSVYPMMNPTPPPTISYEKRNYITAKVGVTIGGGRKKKRE